MGAGLSVADRDKGGECAHVIGLSVKHEAALDGLFVQVLGLLSADGLITLERVMQDGTKIRANAASDSFRRKEKCNKRSSKPEDKWRRWKR